LSHPAVFTSNVQCVRRAAGPELDMGPFLLTQSNPIQK